MNDTNKLWVKILSHKYIRNTSSWYPPNRNNASITWRSITKAIEAFWNGFAMRMGSGMTSFWYTDWLGCGPLCNIVDYVHISDNQLSLKDVWDMGTWSLDKLATPLPSHVKDTILNKVVPSITDASLSDTWTWQGNKDGIFSVASGYSWLLIQNITWDDGQNWEWLSKLGVPAKMQVFIWQMLHRALSTSELRNKRGLATSSSCHNCSESIESILHYLRDCPHFWEVWLRLGWFHRHDFAAIMDEVI